MGAQHPELAAYGGGAATSFVSIAKSGDVELAAIDGLE